jgi:hypothetical protein
MSEPGNRQAPLPSHFSRWWTYQRERFPVFAHGILILAFSSSAVSFSWLLRSHALAGQETGAVVLAPQPASLAPFLVAFGTAFLFFLQLRIADEFKDFEEDSRYRPYRPVPRGLVSLREQGILGVIDDVPTRSASPRTTTTRRSARGCRPRSACRAGWAGSSRPAIATASSSR